MRHLTYAPILHTEADLGSVSGEVRRRMIEAFGSGEWARRRAAVDAMWTGLRAKMLGLPLAWDRVRLYQDGLPVCGHELAITRDMAENGSANHRLLLELMARGATLMGTESAELLVREYRRVQALVKASRDGAPEAEVLALKAEGDALMVARDRFMADRIADTLVEGEEGIVFIGLLHRVDELLEGRVEVEPLMHYLPFGADLWRSIKEQGRR